MAGLLLLVGFSQSWPLSLSILNLCLISSIMALGVNIQWGYAGLFNVGIMGFTALGGIATVLISMPPIPAAVEAGGTQIAITFIVLLIGCFAVVFLYRFWGERPFRKTVVSIIVICLLFLVRHFYGPASSAIEAVDAAKSGYLGGLGMPIIFSWFFGGVLAAGAAWLIGKITLGLRTDYLAIATLGIAEIIMSLLKNEDWLTRGVKNVSGLPRPVPFELDLQQSTWFINFVRSLNSGTLSRLDGVEYTNLLNTFVVEGSSIFVKLCYTVLFSVVLITIFTLCSLALKSPWGRMIRSIRDNEVAASAMGKNVTARHLQIFVLGSAVVGIAGAMLATLDGQFTPGTYNPLRYTFLIWVMVIVGGSGNNLGSILGGFLVWFIWIEAEPASKWLMEALTQGLDPANGLRQHLINSTQYMRLIVMGVMLLVVMRFTPGGILPEKIIRGTKGD
jgi:branched-chain amino acid transport system permease protein